MRYRLQGRLLVWLALLLPVFVVTGCLDPPDRFRIERIEKVQFRADHVLLRFGCSVYNPNGSSLRVSDLDAALRVENVELGRLEPVRKLVLRRKQKTEFSAAVAVPYGALLRLAPLLLTRRDYRVEVEGRFRAGTWWSFRKNLHHTEFMTVDIREALMKELLRALQRKKDGIEPDKP